MLIPTIDIRDGSAMTPMSVDPACLPRRGDRIEITNRKPDRPTIWFVDGIVWGGHPDELKPTAIRLTPEVALGVPVPGFRP